MSLSTATQYCILSVGFLICTVMSKRRATWGKEDLAAALNAIESGTSQRDAAKAFNILYLVEHYETMCNQEKHLKIWEEVQC